MRKSSMKALMSSRPFRGSCSEYFSSMSGAPIASTTSRLQVFPQNSVNQRPTAALLSSCKLMELPSRRLRLRSPDRSDDLERGVACLGRTQTPVLTPVSCRIGSDDRPLSAPDNSDLKARTGERGVDRRGMFTQVIG